MCSQCRLPQQTKREGSGETAPWEGSGETAPREGSGETAPTSNPSNNGVRRLAPSRRRELLGQCHDPTHRSPCAGVATLSRRRKLLGPSCTHPTGTSPKGAEVVTLARRRKLLGPSHTHLRGRGTPRLLTRLAPSNSRTLPSSAEVVTLARRRKLLGPSHAHLRGRGTPRLLTRLGPSNSCTLPSEVVTLSWRQKLLGPMNGLGKPGPANPYTNMDLALQLAQKQSLAAGAYDTNTHNTKS